MVNSTYSSGGDHETCGCGWAVASFLHDKVVALVHYIIYIYKDIIYIIYIYHIYISYIYIYHYISYIIYISYTNEVV